MDHQLRESGGPTFFLVVLTTTNVTTLGNFEPNVFTLAMCFHIVNFVKPQRHDRGQFKEHDRSQCQ